MRFGRKRCRHYCEASPRRAKPAGKRLPERNRPPLCGGTSGVSIDIQYLENEAYKKKMTTLLQSPDRPHIIYSWGGGVLREQVKAGVIEDLSAAITGSWRDRFSPAAILAYTLDGKVYGVPMQVSQVGFFYNRDLFAKAGVDAAAIKTWDDLLAAVKKLKTAGVTPIIAGGGDKWPIHFYWTHLAIRNGGKAAFEAALRGDGEGFAAAPFVKAGEQLKQLVDLEPFQPGFLAVTFPQSSGQFGDGKGAMVLQGNFMLNSMRANSADKKGVPDDKLGWFPFPVTAGGKGEASDTLGGLNGWLVTKGSPIQAVDFLKYFSNPEFQREAAARGFYIPVVKARRTPSPIRSCAASPRTSGVRDTTRSSTIRCSVRPSVLSSTTSRRISRQRSSRRRMQRRPCSGPGNSPTRIAC